MSPALQKELISLSLAEKLLIMNDLWDQITSSDVDIPLSEEHKAELDSRLESYEREPDEGSSWQDVKKRILDSS